MGEDETFTWQGKEKKTIIQVKELDLEIFGVTKFLNFDVPYFLPQFPHLGNGNND